MDYQRTKLRGLRCFYYILSLTTIILIDRGDMMEIRHRYVSGVMAETENLEM